VTLGNFLLSRREVGPTGAVRGGAKTENCLSPGSSAEGFTAGAGMGKYKRRNRRFFWNPGKTQVLL